MARRLSPAAQARLHRLQEKGDRDAPQVNASAAIVEVTGVVVSAPASAALR
jgi:hypothetical protein